ncbi:hypothetical protein C8R47DRAFT_1179777 [Mycena vitilis]|nr:hypothetical protein C8R47DRAFT_1179777 [Mycena vitilis]
MHSSTRLLALVPLLAAGANALNDWTVPCTSGECSYDLPSANNSSSGSLKIWGSNNAITDITKAAGWEIIGCNSSALAQDIRLVCTDDPDDPNSKCSHLYQEIGAVNKIVRLPENCGASAFARVSKSWVPEDQSIPAAVRRSLVRRDGKTPVVKALALDTNFDAVDYSKTGPVNIAIQGANVPGVPTDIQTPSSRRARTTHRRFSIDNALGSIKDGIDNAASSVKAAAGDVKDAAESVASKATSAVKGAATKVESKAKAVANNTIDVSKDINLKPLTFDKSVNLVNSQINCGKASASLQVDMDANANAQATLSVAATGTIVPPKLTSMGVIAGMTADVTGTMTMTADITGHVDSGKITLVNLGIPGLDFPGILTVGPSFTLSAQVVGDVDVVMDMTVGLNFNLTAHLIPSLNLGVSALGGKAKANIFLNLDTNAALEMNLDGSASATKVVNAPPAVEAPADDSTEDGTEDTTDTTEDDTATTDGGVATTKSLGGCVNVNGAISVNAGAEGSFFGLFDKLANKQLFNKNFKIFTVRPKWHFSSS